VAPVPPGAVAGVRTAPGHKLQRLRPAPAVSGGVTGGAYDEFCTRHDIPRQRGGAGGICECGDAVARLPGREAGARLSCMAHFKIGLLSNIDDKSLTFFLRAKLGLTADVIATAQRRRRLQARPRSLSRSVRELCETRNHAPNRSFMLGRACGRMSSPANALGINVAWIQAPPAAVSGPVRKTRSVHSRTSSSTRWNSLPSLHPRPAASAKRGNRRAVVVCSRRQPIALRI